MNEKGVTASLIDRLFWNDNDPRILPGRITETAYIASAVRDLQDLLNTRNTRRNLRPPRVASGSAAATPSGRNPSTLGHVDSSVIMLGMPDFSSLSLARSEDRERLANEIVYTIRTFDRRFSDVSVELATDRSESGALPFVIRAKLKVADSFATVGLEARYQSSNMRFTVSEPGRARSTKVGFASGEMRR